MQVTKILIILILMRIILYILSLMQVTSKLILSATYTKYHRRFSNKVVQYSNSFA